MNKNDEKELFIISILKKCASHIRTSVKILFIIAIAGMIILGITSYIYKPIYSVTLNDELLGYTQDKNALQSRINEYIRQGDGGNIAFIQVENMPKYQLCLLKKSIETNDDEIYEKVVNQGTTYYRYYALLNDGEEKYFFSTFEQAENVVETLKEKDSANVDKLTVVEKYNTENAEYSEVEPTIESLYEKKVVVVQKTTTASTQKTGTAVGASGMNNSSTVVDLGITLIKPVSGTITSRYGLRSRDNHKGLDIGASYGTSIVAAAGGTVTTSAYGYNGGYGNYVIISHGNGIQTLYGHCSSLCVSQGETVTQGQLIAKVGSTGLSTGNHCHFEVRVNGVTQNPQNYVY